MTTFSRWSRITRPSTLKSGRAPAGRSPSKRTSIVTVPFNTSGSAASPADYTLAPPSTLVIPAGQVSGNLTVTLFNDLLDEVNETLVVDLLAPTNGTLGTTTGMRIRIMDEADQPDLPPDDDTRQLNGIRQDYQVWHNE